MCDRLGVPPGREGGMPGIPPGREGSMPGIPPGMREGGMRAVVPPGMVGERHACCCTSGYGGRERGMQAVVTPGYGRKGDMQAVVPPGYGGRRGGGYPAIPLV